MNRENLLALAAFLAFGACSAVGGDIITGPVTVDGTGSDQTQEFTGPVVLEQDKLYAFRVRISGLERGGVAVMGPEGAKMYANCRTHKTNEWVFVFRAPSDAKAASRKFELGQWHVPGRLVYERAEVFPVSLRCRRFGELELGYGERLDGDFYTFELPTRTGTLRNVMRIPSSFHKTSPDWTIKAGGSVTLTHSLPGRNFRRARVSVLPNRLSRGALTVEASADGGPWRVLGGFTNIVHFTAELPSAMFPAKEIRLRLCGDGKFFGQVSKYGFDGDVDGERVFGFGATDFFGGDGGNAVLSLKPWDYLSAVTGERVAGGNGVACWRESSGRKVARGRPLPSDRACGVELKMAANEAEAAQLVFRPEADVDGVRVEASALVSAAGATIGTGAVRVRRVGYLMIDMTMDSMGARGRWPDPIFDQDDAGCGVRGGENQPFWVCVKPPKGTPKGKYRGELAVSWRRKGEACLLKVPLEAEVFGFELPDEMTCETAFGCPLRAVVFPYHRVKTAQDVTNVTDKYHAVLAEHHISPYSPATRPKPVWRKPDARRPETWTVDIDWSAWDAAMERAFDRWHFNTFMAPLAEAIGGGDFMNRREPSIAGVSITNNPAAYDVLVGRYLKAVESHLVEKGWIDKAYVYWFDEPQKKDYDFVMRGNDILRRHAPRLRRMLTEEPKKALVGGPNLWCPLTGYFHSESLEECRRRGDQFWWYVTFSSEQPLVNEHVEHSGVDNRLWLWQTWKERVRGILIWSVCHWTSKKSYPDRLQNPYEDAMCWSGAWRPWNSGEGRYLYPPPACFSSSSGPVLEGPVDSIRLEMLREGIEDYEYFSMLRRIDPENRLLDVPESVMRSLTDYSTDPAAMEAHRLRLAAAIEAGRRELGGRKTK